MRLKLADHNRFKIHLSHTADDASSARPVAGGVVAGTVVADVGVLRRSATAVGGLDHGAPRKPDVARNTCLGGARSRTAFALGAGTIDVGYRQGRIVLTHGDTQLLTAPLSGLPDRVVFEGDAVVHGLEFADGLIAISPTAGTGLEPAGQPADHDWQPELPAVANGTFCRPGGSNSWPKATKPTPAPSACLMRSCAKPFLNWKIPCRARAFISATIGAEAVIVWLLCRATSQTVCASH